MIKWLLGALLLIAPSMALAQNQGQIVPSGHFTPGHTVRCQNSACTVAVDGGGSAGSNVNGQGYLTEIGITNTGTPFCINDALINAVGGYHQLCLGASALGGGLISFNPVGGASPLGLNINVNGVNYPFPGSGNGNVVGPTVPTPTANDIVLWNGGTTVKDSGLTVGTMASQSASAVAITGGTISLPALAPNYSIIAGQVSGTTPITNWLESFMNSPNPNSPIYGLSLGPTTSVSQVSGLSGNTTGGGYGLLGGAQSLNCTAGCNGADQFGVGAFGVNNARTGGATQQNVWAFFGIATALPGAANVGSGFTQGMELDVVNKGLAGQPGAPPQITPYQATSAYSTMAALLASGSGSSNVTERTYEGPATIALNIISNFGGTPASSGTPTFLTGIAISSTALTGGTGADSDTVIRDAISLPRMAGINFWNINGGGTATTPTSSIYSATQGIAAHTDNIRFDNLGVIFETNNGFGAGVEALLISPQTNGTCYDTISNGVALTELSQGGAAANCTRFYNTQGAAGGHAFQVNGVSEASVTAGGLAVNVGLTVSGLPGSAGGGGLFVCVDTSGVFYKKATCP